MLRRVTLSHSWSGTSSHKDRSNSRERGRRDLEELEQALAGTSAGWLEWATRLGDGVRWADAATTLRNGREAWEPLTTIGAQPLADVCDALLEASGGPNADQLRTCLDILCSEAASLLTQGQPNDFCQVVLALLSEQENFSEMVRNAYLDLLAAWLAAGPTANEYDEVIDQTLAIWNRIASPNAVDWANCVLEAMVDAPSPDESKRTSTAVVMIEGVRQHASRLTLRQRWKSRGLRQTSVCRHARWTPHKRSWMCGRNSTGSRWASTRFSHAPRVT